MAADLSWEPRRLAPSAWSCLALQETWGPEVESELLHWSV